jgi:hypothetical protein
LTTFPESVEEHLLFNARDGVRRLRRAFRWLIERWGWDRVVGPDGRAYIAECEKEDRRRGRDLLEVTLALAEGYSRRGQEIPRRWHQFIGTAEAEGVTSSLSFDDAEGRAQTCWERWLRESIVGEAPLACTWEEMHTLGRAIDPLCRYLNETRPGYSRVVFPSPGKAAPAIVSIKTDATEARERQPEAPAVATEGTLAAEAYERQGTAPAEQPPPERPPRPDPAGASRAGPPGNEAPPIAPGSQPGRMSDPGTPAPCDPVDGLRKKRLPIQAALVEYLLLRNKASFDEIKERVHGDQTIGDDAVRKRVSETNKSLTVLDAPIRLTTSAGFVFLHTCPGDATSRPRH